MEPNTPSGPPELPRGTKAPGDGSKPAAAPEPATEPQLGPATHAVPQLVSSRPSVALAHDEDDDPDELNEHVENPGDPDGLVAAEEQRAWQAAQVKKSTVPAAAKPAKAKRHWPWVLVVLLLIAAAAYGAYWYGSKRADMDHKAATAQPAKTATGGDKKSTATNPTVPTKHNDSATYTLGFDYPQTWTVSDTTAKLTVVSPSVSLATSNGSTAEGHVVVTFQNQQSTIAGYPANGAVAALESQKMTYTHPTSVQRAATYVSYLGYNGASNLDALYVTGDNGYQQGQNVPMGDVVKGNPLISVTFQSCTSADCTAGTPTMLTLQAGKWGDTVSAKQVTDLLKSLQLD